MGEWVSWVRQRDVGIITIDNPPVNALSPGVPEAIHNALAKAVADDEIRALVLIGAGRTFIAGADIRELEKIVCGVREKDLGLHPMLQALEECRKPVICAIHGTALGGGLEVAMACHYRIAVPSALMGQPEVKLGLIPGAGGTQRLPRLVGVAKAVEMCSLGEPVNAAEALRVGLLDRLADGDLLAGALGFAGEIVLQGGDIRRTSRLCDKLKAPESVEALVNKAREEVRKRYRGRIAPLKAIDAVEAATILPFAEGIEKERELFEDCLHSEQARALIRAFFGEREVTKIPSLPKDVKIQEIRKIGIVGAGTMGCGIATACANAGFRVTITDNSGEALEKAIAAIRQNYSSSVKRGKHTRDSADRCLSLITPSAHYQDFADVDLVIEAVFEAMEVKLQVFAEIDSACPHAAILATNTSSLDVDALAAAVSKPDRVIGLHFFAPANLLRLMEIVRGKLTGAGVLATSAALARKLGKVGVVVGNGRGFVGNRMFNAYLREAHFLVEEGAKVQEVDAVLYSFGMPMGPFAVEDLSGIDVFSNIRRVLSPLDPPGSRKPLVAGRLCSVGRFGQKSGAGWYRYDVGDRTPHPDPVTESIVAAYAREQGIPQQPASSDEILDRTLYALINEGAKILEEGIASTALDIDIIFLTGFGFPAHRGGPMWFGDSRGLPSVYDRICRLRERLGPHWTPAPLLERLAREDRTFADYRRA